MREWDSILIVMAMFPLSANSRDDREYFVSCLPLWKEPSNCYVADTEDSHWPSDTDRTAPPPTSLTADWFIWKSIDDNESRFVFNITWSQNAGNFPSLVDGYELSIGMQDSDSDDKKHILFRNKTFIDQQLVTSQKVIFNYKWFGGKNLLVPGTTYFIVLQTLPMYHVTTDVQLVFATLHLPDCSGSGDGAVDDEDESVSSTKNCQIYHLQDETTNEDDTYDDADESTDATPPHPTPPRPAPPNSTATVIMLTAIGLSALSLLISLSGCILLIIKRKKRTRHFVHFRRGVKKHSVLILADTTTLGARCPYLDVASRLATIFYDYGGVNVWFNLWEITRMTDPVIWVKDKIKRCDVIIFLFPPRQLCSSHQDPFLNALHQCNILLKQGGGPKARCVSVFYDPSSHQTFHSSFIRFNLNVQFKSLFRHVTGKSTKKIPRSILDGLYGAINIGKGRWIPTYL